MSGVLEQTAIWVESVNQWNDSGRAVLHPVDDLVITMEPILNRTFIVAPCLDLACRVKHTEWLAV